MEELKNRQFHVLSTHPEFHSAILSNAASLQSTLKSWQANLSEVELAMHSRPLSPGASPPPLASQHGFIDRLSPSFNCPKVQVPRLQTMARDPKDPAVNNTTHNRYYRLRASDTSSTKRYLATVAAGGSSAALASMDADRVFSRMYAEAAEIQKASFKKARRVVGKEGGRAVGGRAGGNGPELGPGTYHVERGLIGGRLEDGEVRLKLRFFPWPFRIC